MAWLSDFGPIERVGVEGTGSYGAGLTRHLQAEQVRVVEVDRPNRQRRRRKGKSDPEDAISAARAALSGDAAGEAKSRDGNVELDGQPLLAHTKVRHDRIDSTGCFTLRYRSGFHHVSVGPAHKGKRVLILVADLDVRVFDDDGVMIRHIELDPSVNFQGRSRIIL